MTQRPTHRAPLDLEMGVLVGRPGWAQQAGGEGLGGEREWAAGAGVSVRSQRGALPGRDARGYYYRETSVTVNFIVTGGVIPNSFLIFSDVHEEFEHIGAAIAEYIEPLGYGIVEDLVGHGIGREMHEPPEVPNFRQRSRGIRLKKGMTLAVEPMINMGTWQVDFLDDGWTTLTADRKPSAHYENTILITDGAPEILSLPGGRKS